MWSVDAEPARERWIHWPYLQRPDGLKQSEEPILDHLTRLQGYAVESANPQTCLCRGTGEGGVLSFAKLTSGSLKELGGNLDGYHSPDVQVRRMRRAFLIVVAQGQSRNLCPSSNASEAPRDTLSVREESARCRGGLRGIMTYRPKRRLQSQRPS